MRLYHLKPLAILLMFVLLAGCAAPEVTQGVIDVSISADGQTGQIQIAPGSTVETALETAGLTLDTLDRAVPPMYTVLTDGGLVSIIRVTEEFSVEEITIPFDNQIVKNESLPEGETRLIQPGVNGLQEITSRMVFEDGAEVSVSQVKIVTLQNAVPEILMVGSQTPFAPVNISGRLAYLSGGNAWLMEGITSNRRPILTTGDLDGRVFKLSPDGLWLLFTRRSDDENMINTLWVKKIDEEEMLFDLGAANIVHFADWSPNSTLRVAYSTVEPRDIAPGWQANNDLQLVSFSSSGWVSRPTIALETNSGGLYGWWGTDFAWAEDGVRLAYARPNEIGILDLQDETLTPLLAITPLQTQGDWAWVPGLTWNPAGDILFTVDHAASPGAASPEESPSFTLKAVPLGIGVPVSVLPGVGMFAYPVPSPADNLPSGELAYQIAYLQAIFPNQSDSSRYRLVTMDRDGSNRNVLFPEPGAPGLEPQQVYWSPEVSEGAAGYWLAFIYEGNLWLVDPVTGEAHQLTGDGLIDRADWR